MRLFRTVSAISALVGSYVYATFQLILECCNSCSAKNVLFQNHSPCNGNGSPNWCPATFCSTFNT